MAAVLSLPCHAQTKDGGISADMLREIQQSQKLTTADKALFNAVASNSIDNLAQNYANQGALDTYFSVETKSQNITDQKQSGRCWMFSGFNVLRSNFANRTDSLRVDLSQDYLFFWDQLEKSNLFLQGVIDCASKSMDDVRVQFFFKSPLNDGGTFCGVSDLVDKYGLVPAEVMPETFSAENTSKATALIKSKLREFGLKLRDMANGGKSAAEIKAEKTKMLGEIYHMLALTMGEPVKEFTYAFKNKDGRTVTEAKKYTPKSFAAEMLDGKAIGGSFIMVMNDPRREYYKTYEVEYDRHTYDGTNWKYLNLPMEEIAKLAIASLKDGKKMYSSYDVGKFLDRKRGYCDPRNYDYGSLFGTTFGMNKAQRIMTYDSGSTHAMTLTAVDLDAKGNPTKWKVENSWGGDWGQKGCLIMTNEWFNEYMFRLVVDKKYVPAKTLKQYEQKPVMVMPEDPLFLLDE
ncbi:aminopeptidase C [uncultured Prevotella sp.]|uniref:aminopeptidase C n=1 Tax=uncultured Prevotella sp. TaxID=159272 RepID=UPI0026277E18|nr:C1 family peptidase [uncultured Prevotella sp.]